MSKRHISKVFKKTLKLIESSAEDPDGFNNWDELRDHVRTLAAATEAEVTVQMWWRCFLRAGGAVATFTALQEELGLELDTAFLATFGRNLLHSCCTHGWAELAGQLLDRHGVDVNIRKIAALRNIGSVVETIKYLHCFAVSNFNVSLSKAGLRRDGSRHGYTPLMLAAMWGQVAVVAALLARPATRLELRNSLGMTAALHLGPAAARAVSVLRLLTRHGAQLHAEDDSGRSVLAWAAKKPGLGRVVSFLVEEAGCEVTARVMAAARPEHRALLGDRLGCPRSLKVHARNAIWRMVRNASSGDPESHLSYVIKMETLTTEGTMPRSLRHYLAMN